MFYIGVSFTQYGEQLAFSIIGLAVIAVVWIVNRNWIIPATLLFLSVLILDIFQSPDWLESAYAAILVFTLVFMIAYAIRNLVKRVHNYEAKLVSEREESRLALEAVRANLALHLHDNVAKDLTRVMISLEELAMKYPKLASDISPIENTARNASSRIRPIILNLQCEVKETSIQKAIEESQMMLQARALVLNIVADSEFEVGLKRQTVLIAALFIRETAANALKYAEPNSEVSLFIERDSEELHLTMVNAIAEKLPSAHFTGGFGLRNLHSKFIEEGGKLSFTRDGNRWVITASIADKGKSDE
ncbi:hypothetical protein RQN30_09445 [Arcanobacterium hippocoleae]